MRFWHGANALDATAFPKDYCVQQAEVVENKRLSETMDLIRDKQRRRAEARIEKPTTALRNARLPRAGTPRRTTTSEPSEAQP